MTSDQNNQPTVSSEMTPSCATGPGMDQNLQRGLSRSVDVINKGKPPDRGSNMVADSNNNSKRLESFKRKFSCPEIAAILDQYIPREEMTESEPVPDPSPMRRSRSLNELPGSVRVPILKRTETERMRARLEASIAGTEELNKLRENQEKLMAETRNAVNLKRHQNRRQSYPTRTSSSHLTRIFEEENDQEESDQEVFYDEQPDIKKKSVEVTSPRRTQSYRDRGSSGSSRCENPDVIQVPGPSWTMLTKKAESYSDIPMKRTIRSNSLFVGNTGSHGLLSQTEPPLSESMDLKLRRSSLQSDAVLTGWNRSNKSSSIFENMDIKSTSPNPIRAVLMQYEVSKRNEPLKITPKVTTDQRKNTERLGHNRNLQNTQSKSAIQNSCQVTKPCDSLSRSPSSNIAVPGHLNMGSLCPRSLPFNPRNVPKPKPRKIVNTCPVVNNPSANSPNCDPKEQKSKMISKDDEPEMKSTSDNKEKASPSETSHNKYNSIASDDSLLAPSNYSSFCSSNLSSNLSTLSLNSSKIPNTSLPADEGYIASPPGSPDYLQSNYSFQSVMPDIPEASQKTESTQSILKQSRSKTSSERRVQKINMKEIPSNSHKQTEV